MTKFLKFHYFRLDLNLIIAVFITVFLYTDELLYFWTNGRHLGTVGFIPKYFITTCFLIFLQKIIQLLENAYRHEKHDEINGINRIIIF